MIGIDPVTALALGWLFARRSGSATAPPTSSVPAPPLPPPTTPAGTPVPFPSGVTSPDPRPGFVKAVEVWRINPGSVPGVLVGVDDAVVAVREREFPRGWQSVPQSQVTKAEMDRAVALLSSWKKGAVRFEGARTVPGRRAFVMTEHPRRAVPAAPPPPVAPPATVPASFPTTPPAPPPQAPPVRPAPSAPVPAPPPPPAVQTGPQTTAVRPGEGLINIVRRVLGTRDQDQRWIELRSANVPNDADGRPRQRIALTADHPDAKGGILPRLQPGQRLFIPPSWGRVDPARL